MSDVPFRLDDDVAYVPEEEASVTTRDVTTSVLILSAVTFSQQVAAQVQSEFSPVRH